MSVLFVSLMLLLSELGRLLTDNEIDQQNDSCMNAQDIYTSYKAKPH
jgi:hypothetical protein